MLPGSTKPGYLYDLKKDISDEENETMVKIYCSLNNIAYVKPKIETDEGCNNNRVRDFYLDPNQELEFEEK
jgi:hypothetical protein